MVKAVLLDVDGTLVLSNDAHALAWVEAFVRHGYKVDYQAVRPLIGMGSDKIFPKLVPEIAYEPDISEKISSLRSKIFLKKYVPSLKPAPGSRAFVERLGQAGFRLMVASSAKKEELGALLKAAQVDDLLKEATTSTDTDASKPDPDIVHAALDKLGLLGPEALMVGDTPYDIEAAKLAGVRLVAVRCGGWSDKDLKGAASIYNDPSDIVGQYNTSPFAHH